MPGHAARALRLAAEERTLGRNITSEVAYDL